MANNLKDVIKIESFIEDKGYKKDKIKEIQDIEDIQKRFENLIDYLIDYCKYLEKECKEYKELHEYETKNYYSLKRKYDETLEAIKNIPHVKLLQRELDNKNSRAWDNCDGIQGVA